MVDVAGQPTKEQWAELAVKMDSIHISTHLDCDGYLIATQMARHKNKLFIQVYVDGSIKGKWMNIVDSVDDFDDVPKRFYRHTKRQRTSAKHLKMWEKIEGKRECKKKGRYGYRYLSVPDWTSANSLIRHLKKYNQNIEILNYETYKDRLDKKQEQENDD